MSQQRMALWTAEEIDEEFQGVDLSLAIGNYGQNELYDDGSTAFPLILSINDVNSQCSTTTSDR